MKKLAVFILFLSHSTIYAQQLFRLSDAVDTALKNNYDIRIARVYLSIAENNNTFGMAGGLPVVSLTGNDNNTLSNLEQKTSSGLNIVKDNVRGSTVSAAASAGIILFNGEKIVAEKKRLASLESQNRYLLNQQIQNTVADVFVTYFDMLRQQSYLNIIKSTHDVSQKKLDIVLERSKAGMANQADILQARMDLNEADQNLLNEELVIKQNKIGFLQLLGVRKYFEYAVNDSIRVDRTVNLDSVRSNLVRNQQYLAGIQQIRINEQMVREIRAQRYPTVRLNAGYNFNYNSSTAGFNLFNQTYGPSAGVSLQIPVFNGTIYKTQQKAASFNVESARLQNESYYQSILASTLKIYEAYLANLKQLSRQKVSFEDAGNLVAIVLDRFRLNQATILDVKAAQASYETAAYMFINLQYAAKSAEIELKRLSNSLVF